MPKASTAKSKTTPRTAKKVTAKASPKAKPAAKKPAAKKKSTAKKAAAKQAEPAGEQEVTIDRRAAGAERRSQEAPADATAELTPRKKVNRRRQIDPTTCERDYSDAEVEFMNAMDEYKRTSGRMFPTCSEVLEVIRSLGYVQLSPAELSAREPADTVDSSSEPADEQADELEAELQEEDADGLLV